MPTPNFQTFRSSAEGWLDSPVASAARTTSSNSAAIPIYAPLTGMVVVIRNTAVSGTTPTLDVDLEDSLDGGTTWQKVVDINSSNITTVSTNSYRLDLRATPTSDLVRIKWTIGGTATPTFTFSVDTYSARF